MKKKLLTAAILTLSAVLLVAASVLGTYALLASSSAVSNTFTVGNVGIQMFESKIGADGITDDDGDDRTAEGNTYKLIPGATYKKDPAIFVNAGSVESYLFVKVKNGISTIEKQGDPTHPTMKEQMVNYGWQLIKEFTNGDELFVYVGAGNAENLEIANVKPEEVIPMTVGNNTVKTTYPVFDGFTVNDSHSAETLGIYGGAKVTVTAFAIQTSTIKIDAEGTLGTDGFYGYQRAWNKVVETFPFENTVPFEPVTTASE